VRLRPTVRIEIINSGRIGETIMGSMGSVILMDLQYAPLARLLTTSRLSLPAWRGRSTSACFRALL
jgi:hypothetical protein